MARYVSNETTGNSINSQTEGRKTTKILLCKAELRSISQDMVQKKQKLNRAEPKAEQDARRHTKVMKKPLINKRLRRRSHHPVITERRQLDVKKIKGIR